VTLTVLGSGTLLPDDAHHSPAFHLRAGGLRCLLDCGSGTLHGMARYGLSWSDLDVLAFSHFHTDHLGDLAPLFFAFRHGLRPPRTEPLTLVGPPGLEERLEALAAAFGDHVIDPGFPVRVRELGRRAGWQAPGAVLRVRFHPTAHTDRSVAHRWEAGGCMVAYTGDTGPQPELGAFLRGADVLISECGLPDGTEMELHMTPSRVAVLAREARPRLLITTHVYPPLVPEEVPELVAEAGWAGRVEAGRDGMVVELGSRGELRVR